MPRFIIVHYQEDPEAIMQFLANSRFLWNDHIIYTRNAIISLLGGLDDVNAVADRLSANQEAIGQLLTPYYGETSATKLADLLKEHVGIVTDIIRYKKADRDTAELEAKCMDNAKAIADFLASLDAVHWPADVVLAALTTHITDTLAEINARVGKDWAKDIEAFDSVRQSIVPIADAISTGIVDKFPEKFVKYEL